MGTEPQQSSERTVLAQLKRAQKRLEDTWHRDPRLIAEELMGSLLDLPRLKLFLHPHKQLTRSQIDEYWAQVERVAGGEPLQFITGRAGFMGFTFKTDRRALIPRPETECLVEDVLGYAPLWQQHAPHVVDVGTGSGCIILSLATLRPRGRYTAIDISEEAIGLARENEKQVRPKASVDWLVGNLLDELNPGTADAIVSNLPYIRSRDIEELDPDIRQHEPREALNGGHDGLDLIRRLARDAGRVLKDRGALFLEVGDGQADDVLACLDQSGFEDIRVHNDLTGRCRTLRGIYSK